MRRLIFSIIIFIPSFFPLLAEPAPPGEYLLITPEKTGNITAMHINDVEYIPASQLTAVLDLEFSVNEEKEEIVVRAPERSAVLSLKKGVAAAANELIALRNPPRVIDESIYIPMEFMNKVLDKIVDKDGYQFGPADELFVNLEMAIGNRGDSFKLTLSKPSGWEKKVSNERISLFFPGSRITPKFTGSLSGSDAIDRITHESSPLGDRIYLYFEESKGEGFRTSVSGDDPGRIVLVNFVAESGPGTKERHNGEARGIELLVLDPGHGGEALGAVGPGGLMEKDVVLDVCRILKKMIEENTGMQVILTRDSDFNLSLEDRTEIANELGADLFISVHANAARRHDAQGAETYFLSYEATDDEARKLAAIENYGRDYILNERDVGKGDLDFILWDLAQSQYLEESSALAETIQDNLNRYLGVRNRGIKQAPFKVLVGATMPSVLVEIGFITNPEEERKLKQMKYCGKICNALLDSVIAFRTMRDQKLGTPPINPPDE